MPIFKNKNEDFFKKWTPEMAYILGFFTADGSMTKNKRGAHFIEFEIVDGDLLKKIRKSLSSDHKISIRKRSEKRRCAYRLQIGSKEIFDDLLKLNLVPNKSKRVRLPYIPQEYFSHFVRGYFDGDGSVWFGLVHRNDRPKPTKALLSRFISCSNGMLQDIAYCLHKLADTKLKNPAFGSGAFCLNYSTNDSRKIYKFIYNGENNLYLNRKKIIFEKYLGT